MPNPPLKPAMRWAVCSNLSSGTMAFRMSLTTSQNFSCSCLRRTTSRVDCELNAEGVWRTMPSRIAFSRASETGDLFVSW